MIQFRSNLNLKADDENQAEEDLDTDFTAVTYFQSSEKTHFRLLGEVLKILYEWDYPSTAENDVKSWNLIGLSTKLTYHWETL